MSPRHGSAVVLSTILRKKNGTIFNKTRRVSEPQSSLDPRKVSAGYSASGTMGVLLEDGIKKAPSRTDRVTVNVPTIGAFVIYSY